jgi:hypothetical protein
MEERPNMKSVSDGSDGSEDSDVNAAIRFATSVSSESTDSSSVASDSSEPAFDPLDIKRFIPSEPSRWRSALFKLARHTYGRDDADAKFAEWNRLVKASATSDEVADEWLFCKAEVKHPARIKLLDILERSAMKGIPHWISERFVGHGQLQAVTAFLSELEAETFPAEDFFISTRDLAGLFGTSQSWAARTLRYLCRVEILEVVKKGGPDTQKATRFRFKKQGRTS